MVFEFSYLLLINSTLDPGLVGLVVLFLLVISAPFVYLSF